MNSRVNIDPTKLEVERAKCEDEHLFFTRRFFKPRMGFKFTVNWHHAYVAWLIDEVVKGNIANLVINVPPGAGKTELTTKPMQWFEPKADGRLIYRQDGLHHEVEVDQKFKFFLTQCKPTYENPYGEALLSRLYWVWFFKTNAFKYWAKFVERFGNPLLKGKSIDNKAMKKALLEAHASAVIAIDRSDEVEIVSASGSQGGSSAFEAFDKTLEKRIQKVILGGTLTSGTDGSGSRALGDVHLEVEKNKLGADIRMITPTLQKAIDALCLMNQWKSHRIIIGEEKSLEEKKADRDVKLKNAGANLTPQYFIREYGLQEGDVAELPSPSTPLKFSALPQQAFSFKAGVFTFA